MNDDVFEFDLDAIQDFTLDEIDEIEQIAGQPFDSLTNPDIPKARLMKALAFVATRRTDPDFTIEDAGRLRIRVADSTGVPDPTDAAS